MSVWNAAFFLFNSVIRISIKSWHMLINLSFHIFLTCVIYIGGITQSKSTSICQAVSKMCVERTLIKEISGRELEAGEPPILFWLSKFKTFVHSEIVHFVSSILSRKTLNVNHTVFSPNLCSKHMLLFKVDNHIVVDWHYLEEWYPNCFP